MNGNDLMNALSGLDPKYIDEAAIELHGKPEKKKAVRQNNIRRFVLIALPTAAAVLLTLAVALPAIQRSSKSESATSAVYEAGSSDSAAEAPADAAPSYSDAEASYDAEALYESEAEAPSMADEAVGDASDYTMAEPSEPVAVNESATVDAETIASASSSQKTVELDMQSAEYKDGILTITVLGTLPDDISDISYVITSTDKNGSLSTRSEGLLTEIITERDPLTLDITSLALPNGSYELTIGDEAVEFTI